MAEDFAQALFAALGPDSDDEALKTCADAFVREFGKAAADAVLSLQQSTSDGDATLTTLRVLTAIWAIEDGARDR